MIAGGEPILDHYPMLLSTLSHALSKETFPRALDNISGAVSRLIYANVARVPMEQVGHWKMVWIQLRNSHTHIAASDELHFVFGLCYLCFICLEFFLY